MLEDNGQIVKKAAYVVLGIDKDGMKKVLTITIGENESAKYWMTVLNELKNRGVQDILVLCADGLTGLKDAISAIYPKAEYQRCIVHQIRNSLKYVPYTDRKELANDLKTVYKASTEELGYTNLLELEEKWKHKYPGAIQSWIDNWDVLSVFFKFSAEIRKIMYTTNAIESLNSTYKRINRNRNVFPTDMSLLKVLYLSTLLINGILIYFSFSFINISLYNLLYFVLTPFALSIGYFFFVFSNLFNIISSGFTFNFIAI